MQALWRFNGEAVIAMLFGVMTSLLLGIDHPENSWFLRNIVVWLLVTGIYLASTGIDLNEAREHWRLILVAISAGVFLKWIIISTVLALFTGLVGCWLAIGLVQIDPITTVVVKRVLQLTPAGETVVTTVATYDDVVTSVTSVSVVITLGTLGIMHPVLPGGMGLAQGWSAILAPLVFAFIVVSYLAILKWRAYRTARTMEVSASALGFFRWLAGSLFTATITGGAAPTGMLVRPRWLQQPVAEGSETTFAEAINRVVFWVVFFILGITIPGVKIAWWIGLLAGTAAYFAQVPAARLAFRANALLQRNDRDAAQLPRQDMVVFGQAQLLGLTAVSLGLNGQFSHVWAATHVLGQATSGPLSVLLPAILVCNMWHLLFNTGYLWVRRR